MGPGDGSATGATAGDSPGRRRLHALLAPPAGGADAHRGRIGRGAPQPL